MKGKKKYFYVCQLIWTDVNIMCKDLWLIDTDSKLEPNNFQYVRDITMACVYLSWRIKINDSHILQSCVLLIYVRKIKRRKFLLYIIQIVSTIYSIERYTHNRYISSPFSVFIILLLFIMKFFHKVHHCNHWIVQAIAKLD